MDITRFAIQNDRVTFVAVAVVLVGGVSAFLSLPQAEDPGFIIRTAVVQTLFPGANPERVENLITDKLEEAIQEMPELDFVSSESSTGISVIYVNIKESYSDMRPIWDSLRRKVQRAQRDLPDGAIGPFVDDEFGDTFGTIIALTAGDDGTGAPEVGWEELERIAEEARDRLLRLDSAAKVDIHGVQEQRVFVEYVDSRLAELGLSVMQLQQALEQRNILISGGSVHTQRERIELEPSGNFETLDDLRRTVISVPGRSDFLYLEDIAEVSRGYIDPPTGLARAFDTPALILAVSMKDDGNIVELGHQVRDLVAQLNRDYPIGIDFRLVAYQTEQVEKKVDEFTVSVGQAIAIVLGVMLLMLGPRTGLIVATLVPSAMLATLLLMQPLDLTLNQMTLASLIIALGMLVDNAIVMAESIMVEMAAGRERVEAAVRSARELRIPLLTSSLTTSAAFLPIYLAESTTGEYTGVLFTVVTVTLLCSWVLALTLIPLLCVKFLKVKGDPDGGGFDGVFYRSYRGVLKAALRFPPLTLLAVVAVFMLSLQGFALIPNIFFPPSDRPMFTAEIELPVGTAIERTRDVVERIDGFVADELTATEERLGVTSWSVYVGEGAPRYTLTYTPEPPSPEYSYFVFNTSSLDVFDVLIPKLETFVLETFPDVSAEIKPLQLGAPVENPIEVRISGRDLQQLFSIADDIKAQLAGMPGTKNIGDNWGRRTKKIFVRIDGPRARRSGVTHQDIAVSLRSVLVGYDATDYREGDDVIPVIVRSVEADRRDIGKLESLNVYAQSTGRSVPLKQVAELEVEWQPSTIYRRDRLKNVTVYADLDPSVTATEVTDPLIPWLEETEAAWPAGYLWELGGEYEGSVKANQSIGAKMPIGMLIIVLLLVAQFNSLRKPAIILLTIPLGLIGVIIGLIVAQSYFGFMTLLGVISLAGIVINNAIVLLDRIKIEIDENGLEPPRAILEAAQRRLRPILLTTLTTIGGLLPLWLGGGPMWQPMAIAIIFGLGFATLLTLGVVPVLYAFFYRVSFKGFQY